jgi:hypothetical protein
VKTGLLRTVDRVVLGVGFVFGKAAQFFQFIHFKLSGERKEEVSAADFAKLKEEAERDKKLMEGLKREVASEKQGREDLARKLEKSERRVAQMQRDIKAAATLGAEAEREPERETQDPLTAEDWAARVMSGYAALGDGARSQIFPLVEKMESLLCRKALCQAYRAVIVALPKQDKPNIFKSMAAAFRLRRKSKTFQYLLPQKSEAAISTGGAHSSTKNSHSPGTANPPGAGSLPREIHPRDWSVSLEQLEKAQEGDRRAYLRELADCAKTIDGELDRARKNLVFKLKANCCFSLVQHFLDVNGKEQADGSESAEEKMEAHERGFLMAVQRLVDEKTILARLAEVVEVGSLNAAIRKAKERGIIGRRNKTSTA